MGEYTVQDSTLIVVNKKGMGNADDTLQEKLISTYFALLDENDMLPGAIVFYAEGVKMVCEDSPVIDPLKSMESKGVHLIICKTCLNFYDLEDKVRTGIIGGMTDIISAQWGAKKVINL